MDTCQGFCQILLKYTVRTWRMIIRRFLTIKLIKGNRNLEFWNIPSYEILLFIKSEHGQVPLCKTVINRGWQGLPIFTELTRENDVTQNLTNQNEKKCFRAPRKQWSQAVPITRFETFQHCHLFILIIDIIISSSSYHQYDICIMIDITIIPVTAIKSIFTPAPRGVI